MPRALGLDAFETPGRFVHLEENDHRYSAETSPGEDDVGMKMLEDARQIARGDGVVDVLHDFDVRHRDKVDGPESVWRREDFSDTNGMSIPLVLL